VPPVIYKDHRGNRLPSVTTIIGRFKESGGLLYWANQQGLEGKTLDQARAEVTTPGTLAHYERLRQVFDDLFGLTISQGALMNMFARTARAFEEKKGQALSVLRKASFVASDEMGVRIEGVNAFH